MVDLREYKDSIKAAVAANDDCDLFWHWNVRAISKRRASIGWSYVTGQYPRDYFVLEVTKDMVVATDPIGIHTAAYLIGDGRYDDGDAETCIHKAIRAMQRIANDRY